MSVAQQEKLQSDRRPSCDEDRAEQGGETRWGLFANLPDILITRTAIQITRTALPATSYHLISAL